MNDAKLYFKYGVMGAGKTRDLQMKYYSCKELNKKVIIIKPFVDTKGNDTIVSRDNRSIKVDFTIKEEDNIYILICDYITKYNLDCVLVDEAQFLNPKQIDELSDIVDYLKIPVICYGIRVDFLNNLFPGSKRLLEIADVRLELLKECACGNDAIYNIRFNSKGTPLFTGEQVAIDGDNCTYKSMCRNCYKKLKKTIN